MSPILEQIQEQLQQYPEAKLGFVVYRCTYGDDAAWKRCLNFLTVQALESLKDTELESMSSRLDWNVQENKRVLDGASFDVVREDFRHWIEDGHEINIASPRHHACIVIDKPSLQSILRWQPTSRSRRNFDADGSTWVNLLSKRDEDPHPVEEDEEEDDDDSDAGNGLLKNDDREPQDKVSCCRVGTSYLVPRIWELMEGPGWKSFAHHPGGRVVTE
ncbi:hypothetical protein P154DRAFT_604358 [Amniculicola lignicola CBS 123094]|uniref:Uncharacterized protein n=1 Tax=Amniculicola lignicola CBS 123094 TaxID=1392246 RepID=A0A6A5WB23_9PLEO|nr:hypothetical protein P154DRAFT_604358 [Amniculicola lignicola CBS 123094]